VETGRLVVSLFIQFIDLNKPKFGEKYFETANVVLCLKVNDET
jgi:hypothetical protein